MGGAEFTQSPNFNVMLVSAERINKKHCYHVIQVAGDTIEFVTDSGVEYQINFMPDYTLWEEYAYQFVIINKNKKSSPNDSKLKDTLIYIVEDFFENNKNILLYICETGDGKQAARSKLFLRWFASYSRSSEYFFKSTEVISDEEQDFAAIILRKDNPDFIEITRDFEEMITLLGNKPE